jgi:hypothetical protein
MYNVYERNNSITECLMCPSSSVSIWTRRNWANSSKRGGGGGSSLDFFARITGIPKQEMQTFQINISMSQYAFEGMTDLVLYLFNSTKEPALVSCFKVEKLFKTESVVFDYEVEEYQFDEYAQENGRNTHALHSMVMIGAHKEPSGKVWLLLQNFWKGSYLRLVSAEYLTSCCAKVYFVPMNYDVSLSERFDLVDAAYAETSVKTREECVDPGEEEGAGWIEV